LLQLLDALQGAAFAWRGRILELLAEQLEIQAEGAEMVFDFVDESAGQLSQFLVPTGKIRCRDC
jgi:hypothetical protein